MNPKQEEMIQINLKMLKNILKLQAVKLTPYFVEVPKLGNGTQTAEKLWSLKSTKWMWGVCPGDCLGWVLVDVKNRMRILLPHITKLHTLGQTQFSVENDLVVGSEQTVLGGAGHLRMVLVLWTMNGFASGLYVNCNLVLLPRMGSKYYTNEPFILHPNQLELHFLMSRLISLPN